MRRKRARSRMPTSYAGLMRYFEEYESNINIKPETVFVFIVIVIAVSLLIRGAGVLLKVTFLPAGGRPIVGYAMIVFSILIILGALFILRSKISFSDYL